MGFEAEGKPVAHVVAGDPAPPRDLMIAASAAEITSPARATRFLSVDRMRGKMQQPPGILEAFVHATEFKLGVANQAMTGERLAAGIDAQVPGGSSARMRPGGAAMELGDCCF